MLSPSAVVDPSAVVGQHAIIRDGAIIGERVIVGVGAIIGEGAIIEKDAVIGRNAIIHAGANIQYGATIGNFAIIHEGVTVGRKAAIGIDAVICAKQMVRSNHVVPSIQFQSWTVSLSAKETITVDYQTHTIRDWLKPRNKNISWCLFSPAEKVLVKKAIRMIQALETARPPF